jgi:hypothetical protein
MLLNIGIGSFLVLLTTGIHIEGMLWVSSWFKSHQKTWQQPSHRQKGRLIGGVVLLMFFIIVLEIAVWAAAYLLVGAIVGVEKALYFSTVTFTTLGYGDILLSEKWRLLAAFEAVTGIIMFGLTTALLIAAVQRVYFSSAGED